MQILRAENLSHSFDYPLFENLNLEIRAGASLAVQGSSGCGKSTLLHILSTLLKPKSGKIYYQNKSLYDISENERLKIRRLDFGIIFQAHYLFKGFSAYENIELASILSGLNLDAQILENLGIDKLLNQKVSKLSGGQQQRVSIARVLCKKPKIIFADEPTGNLDSANALNVMEILKDYVKEQNAALIFITHDEKLAMQCDELLKFND